MKAILACLLCLGSGLAALEIQLGAGAAPAERTAAKELAAYLGQMTGTIPMIRHEGAATTRKILFVGATDAARAAGIGLAELEPEEWVVRSIDRGVVLTGGRPRGTLYAVYHYLEAICGVRWWNPWEESVPRLAEVPLNGLALTGKPAFRYRDIYMLYGRDGGRFAARSRVNREGDAPIATEYGGGQDYGPPYHVHTFYMYVPPATYFADHPEFFSLIDGKRQAERHQLCLSNPELRQLVLSKLETHIATSEEQARAAERPPPTVYSISQNDWHGPCQCEACQAIVEREGGAESGLLLDFVNELAETIAERHPQVYLDTLAYQYTQQPPATIRPRDNVIIRLCDTTSNATFPITAAENRAFRDHLLGWERIAAKLRVWDYAVTYAKPRGLPYPSADTYGEDLRFYAEHRVQGVFTELEYPVKADVRDYKVWLLAKLLENPYADTNALARDFCDGFYGPAGNLFRDYRALLRNSQNEKRAHIGMGPGVAAFTFLDGATVRRSQELFDQGETLLAEDEVRLRRWRHARLSLDRATCARWRHLAADWVRDGHSAESFPLDRASVAERIRRTWSEQTNLRLTGPAKEKSLAEMEAELAQYAILPPTLELPERFRDLPAERVFDFTADLTRNWQDIATLLQDPEAESGIANRLAFPNSALEKHSLEKYVLPMPWGLYTQNTKIFVASSTINPEDVPGPGYHWYRLGSHSLAPSMYLYFFWSWIIQLDLDEAFDPENPEAEFDIWARLKFTGPDFPQGAANDPNAIYVERVVLVRRDE